MLRTTLPRIAGCVLVTLGFLSPVPAQETIPASADAADIFDNFGASVHVDGNRLLVGPVRGRRGGGPEIFLFARDASGQWSREASFPSGWRNNFPLSEIPGHRGNRGNWSVLALRDPWLIIGNPHQTVGGFEDAGEVRVYRRGAEGWAEHTAIPAPAPALDGGFGISTAFDGTWLVVGNPGQNLTHVYRLDGTTFTLQQSLQPTNGVTLGFGSDVALTGDQLISRVNAELHVYSLTAGTFTFTQLLTGTGLTSINPFAVDGDLMGIAAASELRLFRRTAGTWAAEGGAALSVPATLRGFAIRDGAEIQVAGYLLPASGVMTSYWRRAGGTWSTPTPIPYPASDVPSATRTQSTFAGFSFAMDAERLYLGARFTSINKVISQGSAYSFRLASGTPVLERTFRHGNGWLGDNLGKWIANDGAWMAASAHGTDLVSGPTVLRDVGVVHLYRREPTGWNRVQTLEAPGGQAFDTFGEVVSMKGDLVVVGSQADYQGINDHGRFHVFRRGAGDVWSLLCELEAPVTPVPGPMAWRTDDTNQDFYPIHPAVTDGEHVVAIYRNRPYAWRTTPTECLPPVEIPIPDRGAVPGAPGTLQASNIDLTWFGGMAPGRVILAESSGLVDTGGGSTATTPARSMIYDFIGGQWTRTHLYTAQTGDACSVRFYGSFTSPTTLRGTCLESATVGFVVTWTDNGGSWTSQTVPLPTFDAGEFARGFAGDSLVTATTVSLPDGLGTQFRIRELPAYAVTETLSTTPACLQGHVADFPRFAADDIFMPCRQADTPSGRRSGELRIFSRNLAGRGATGFQPEGQLVLPPLPVEIIGDSFERVPP